jgi:hypothetical protein
MSTPDEDPFADWRVLAERAWAAFYAGDQPRAEELGLLGGEEYQRAKARTSLAADPPEFVSKAESPRRQRQPRKPTLARVAKQASKAAIAVARYEVKPDGTVVVVTGAPESTEPNPWLADLDKVTRQ